MSERTPWRDRRSFRLALLYLAVLAASHGWRALTADLREPAGPAVVAAAYAQEELRDGTRRPVPRSVPGVAGDLEPEGGVRLAHHDLGDGPGTPALLLHGSPAAGDDLVPLARELAALGQGRRVVALELPGYGRSERHVDDYSARAMAGYCEQLLDQLGIARAHVVGHSMGAAVALRLASRDAGRVASLSMVGGLGVVELELFGSHRLNHLIHGAQLNLLRLAHHGLPHFGALDGSTLSVAYARAFYDTDQRPLREVLETWAGPAQVLHGKQDFLVPPAAAEEHARLMPQAELLLLETGHFSPFTDPAGTAGHVGRFLARVDAGEAPTRAAAVAADPGALARSTAPFDPASIPPATGPALLVLMLLFALGTLVSEDLACIAAGMLVAQGRVEFWPAAAACFVGIYVGDMLLFLAGRFAGAEALRHRPFTWVLSERSVARGSAWFRNNGARAVFLSRLMPGLRLPTYFAAGALQAGMLQFAGLFLLASAVWTPALVGFSAWLAGSVQDSVAWFEEYSLLAFLLLLAAVLVVERVLIPLCTWRGRRLWVGRVRRWTTWEFWPPWLFYPPVVLHVVRLALRHRSVAVVGACNPGIPGGGFVGESKAAILRELQGDGPRPPHILPWALLEPAEDPAANVATARAFVAEHGLPVALKPDVGERGSGVRLLKAEEDLLAAIEGLHEPSILQAFAEGPEYGVFVVRRPGADGRPGPVELFSVTDKRTYGVVGDGVHDLEHLILADRRAVVQAKRHLDAHAEDLDRVPAAGEEVVLCELGTHAHGALFLDGRDEASEELRRAMEEVCAPFEGFCFGRFDLRVRPPHRLRDGRGLQVIELNGMTSEATHVYDPAVSLGDAWRTLREQWTIAYELGAAHRARGVAFPGFREQIGTWLRSRRLLGKR